MKLRLILILLLGLCGYSIADSWGPPRAFKTFSPNGRFFAKIEPQDRESRQANCRVYEQVGNRAILIWNHKLIALPMSAVVSDAGHLICLDEYASLGYMHALVIYSPAGKLLGDYYLEQIFPNEEVRQVFASVSSRYWLMKAEVVTHVDRLTIRLESGYVVTADLGSGKVESLQPMPSLSDLLGAYRISFTRNGKPVAGGLLTLSLRHGSLEGTLKMLGKSGAVRIKPNEGNWVSFSSRSLHIPFGTVGKKDAYLTIDLDRKALTGIVYSDRGPLMRVNLRKTGAALTLR